MAVVPALTVTLTIGTSNVGSRAIAPTKAKMFSNTQIIDIWFDVLKFRRESRKACSNILAQLGP